MFKTLVPTWVLLSPGKEPDCRDKIPLAADKDAEPGNGGKG
jgi:hypothetical protein